MYKRQVLGSIVIEEALKRAGVPKEEVDHVYMGCVIQAGLGQNVARQASIKAGLPIETPADVYKRQDIRSLAMMCGYIPVLHRQMGISLILDL